MSGWQLRYGALCIVERLSMKIVIAVVGVILVAAGFAMATSREAVRDRLVAEKQFTQVFRGWSVEELNSAGLVKGDLRIVESFTWLSDGRLTVGNFGKTTAYLAKRDLIVVYQNEVVRQLNSLKPPRGAEQTFGFRIEPGESRTFKAMFPSDRAQLGFAIGFQFTRN